MIWYVKKKEEEIGSESFTFQMKLLLRKMEEDKRRFEEQFKTQREVMEEMRIGTQAIIKQNQTLKDTLMDSKSGPCVIL